MFLCAGSGYRKAGGCAGAYEYNDDAYLYHDNYGGTSEADREAGAFGDGNVKTTELSFCGTRKPFIQPLISYRYPFQALPGV